MSSKAIAVLNIGQLASLRGARGPRTGAELQDLGLISNAGLFIEGEKIVAVGPSDEIAARIDTRTETIDARKRLCTPGLVDAHTHLVFAGNRADEFEKRISGVSYQEIAKSGGGILSTVMRVRQSSEDELFEESKSHVEWMLRCGTTTVEAKSGYGLSLEEELKMLRVIRQIGRETQLDTVATFLGAHAIPPEFNNRQEEYVSLIVSEMIPRVAEEKLSEFCDVFCEIGYFDVETSRHILCKAKEHGLGIRIHADQLSSGAGARLAAELHAKTADHLEHTDEDGIQAMAEAGVQPVLLPASVFALGHNLYPNARGMIEAGLAVVVATDFNPGSSPSPSLSMAMSLACTQMRMTPAEALTACTINAAHSIARGHDRGSLETGKRADFVIWDAQDFRELPYWFGVELAKEVWAKGKRIVG